jgi:hypothetical protein
VHQGGLLVFRLAIQKVLNIEQFCEKKIQQNQTKYFKKIGASF